MICNQITKPEFTKSQIAECGKCKYASAKVKWCGLFGVRIGEGIILPSKKIKVPRPCNDENFANDFKKAKGMYAKSPSFGKQNHSAISIELYLERRRTCYACFDKSTCPMRGCSRWQKLVLLETKCPLNKWS